MARPLNSFAMDRKSFIFGLTATGIAPIADAISLKPEESLGENSPRMAAPVLKNSYWYIGHLMSFLVTSKDTSGSFALLHGIEIKGLEPPPHIHTREDESFYLLDGEIIYNVGNEVFKAKKGDWVFLPGNILHSFRVQTEQVEVLIHLSPGGFEEYFREMSEPAKTYTVPPRPQGPPDVKGIVETASRYGIKFPGLG